MALVPGCFQVRSVRLLEAACAERSVGGAGWVVAGFAGWTQADSWLSLVDRQQEVPAESQTTDFKWLAIRVALLEQLFRFPLSGMLLFRT